MHASCLGVSGDSVDGEEKQLSTIVAENPTEDVNPFIANSSGM